MPNIAGHLDGLALRVPVPDASITDLVAIVRETPSVEAINDAFRDAATSGRLAGVLEYSDEPLVSSDIINSTASCVFDSGLTMARGHWSRCSAGTTTSRAIRADSPTSLHSLVPRPDRVNSRRLPIAPDILPVDHARPVVPHP